MSVSSATTGLRTLAVKWVRHTRVVLWLGVLGAPHLHVPLQTTVLQFFLIFSNATQFGWFPIMSLSIIVPELHEGCVFRFFCHMLSKLFGANLLERNSSVFTPFEIFSPSPSIWRFVNTELNRRLESVRGNQID